MDTSVTYLFYPVVILAALFAALAAFLVYRNYRIGSGFRKKIQELQSQLYIFKQFEPSSYDWIWMQDENLRFTMISPNCEKAAGLDDAQSQVIGKTRRETSPEGVTEAQWAEHDALLAARKPLRDFKFWRITESGEICYVTVSGDPIFDEDGVFRGYHGVGSDRTSIEVASPKKEGAKLMFRPAVEALTDGICFWDQDDLLVICNSVFRQQSGRAADVLRPGVRFETFLRALYDRGELPDVTEDRETFVKNRLAERGSSRREYRYHMRDGWYVVEDNRTADGGRFLISKDISAIKTLEGEVSAATEKARVAIEQAQIANRTKLEFLATMSHELRTPLNAILGFSEVIRDGSGKNSQARSKEYAQLIHDSGSHLLLLINDILDVSRIESGNMDLQEVYIGPDQVIGSCVRMMSHRAERGGVRLKSDLRLNDVVLRADARAIKQVVLNLVSNAVKFTESSGSVLVTSDRVDGGFEIAVIDTGIGIPAEHIPDIFAPFKQLEDINVRRFEGTGLGLYISKRLVELHQGRISIESEEGVGTTTRVFLPNERSVILDDSDKPIETPVSAAARGRATASATIEAVGDD